MSETHPLVAADLASFATLGVVTLSRDLVARILSEVEGAQPDVVAEETLALTATATARAVSTGYAGAREVREAAEAVLLRLPFTYRDYLAGLVVLENPEESDPAGLEEMEARLLHKLKFYGVHFPAGAFPTERLVTEKMELWMGRVSPPRLPELPTKRLERMGLVDEVRRHLRLVRAYARRLAAVQ